MRCLAVFASVLLSFSCSDVEDVPAFSTDDVGGAARIAIHLPVPEGTFLTCTQGAGGAFSHRGRSTAHDLDFDTSNTADEELFAPVSGRARVHDARPAENFGIHVNIDLGDGTYVVLGHLKRVFVRDGAPVAAGQLLAYEGCTGACTGDHVHVGRHAGDAARPAEYGQSIPLWYYVRSTMSRGGLDTIAGDETPCGIGTGASYASGLQTALWHPNGTVLKAPNKDTAYLVEQGRLRAFADQNAFVSRGYRTDDVLLMSETEPRCYQTGPAITGTGQPTFGPNGLRDGFLLKEQGKSDVYVVSDGAALPVWDEDTLLLMGYGTREIYGLQAGAIRQRFARVGECVTDRGCLLPTTPVRCGGAFLPPPEAEMPAPASVPEAPRILSLRWEAPAGPVPTRITLSGEYRRADGAPRVWWQTLAETHGLRQVVWTMPDVRTGDTFRFSTEFTLPDGSVSWSCLGPYPERPTVQGTASVSVDGRAVPTQVAGDPASSGCGLLVTVP